MGILDPDEGRIRPVRTLNYDPGLFIGDQFKIDGVEYSKPIVDKPPPEEKPEPENLPTQLTPEQQAAISGVGIFEGSEPVTPQEEESKPMTDDQKYMLVGLAVIAAFLGYSKR